MVLAVHMSIFYKLILVSFKRYGSFEFSVLDLDTCLPEVCHISMNIVLNRSSRNRTAACGWD